MSPDAYALNEEAKKLLEEIADLKLARDHYKRAADSLAEEWQKTKDRLKIFEDLHVRNLLGPLAQIRKELDEISESYEAAAKVLNP